MPNPMKEFTDVTWRAFQTIADGFIVLPDRDTIARELKGNAENVTVEDVQRLIPSNMPGFRASVDRLMDHTPDDVTGLLFLSLQILSYRAGIALFTGNPVHKSLFEMSPVEVNDMLFNWYRSKIVIKRRLAHSIKVLVSFAYVTGDPMINKMARFPGSTHLIKYDVKLPDASYFRHDILDLGLLSKSSEITVDVVIIGSGSGAGVMAHELSKKGHSVVVLDKGKYFHPSELEFDEAQALDNLYEGGGGLLNEDSSMTVLAGSTLGGGSTVNWSASLRLNPVVREQWAKRIPWIATKTLDDAYEYVYNCMGCTTEYLDHSDPNKMLIEGSKKLGWTAKEVPQNVGNQPHNCGLCGAGCRMAVKQGGVVYWLREAAANGAKIIDQAAVTEIVQDSKTGQAIGVKAIVKNDVKFFVRAKKIVVSAGSLQTPGVLQRSGFRNGHIGKHLRVHPSVLPNATFPDEMAEPMTKGILTSVITDLNNIDGKGHGPLIEIPQQSLILAAVCDARRPRDTRLAEILLQRRKTALFLVITRDRGEGRVFYKPSDPFQVRIEYKVSKFDANAVKQGLIGFAKLVYLEGATDISVPLFTVPVFHSEKPKSDRSIDDYDFKKFTAQIQSSSMFKYELQYGSAHQMGSCRMGMRPSSSAVNVQGQLWECPNVYVADSSIFPEASGANPMLTVMAMSKVIADNVDKNIKGEDIVQPQQLSRL